MLLCVFVCICFFSSCCFFSFVFWIFLWLSSSSLALFKSLFLCIWICVLFFENKQGKVICSNSIHCLFACSRFALCVCVWMRRTRWRRQWRRRRDLGASTRYIRTFGAIEIKIRAKAFAFALWVPGFVGNFLFFCFLEANAWFECCCVQQLSLTRICSTVLGWLRRHFFGLCWQFAPHAYKTLAHRVQTIAMYDAISNFVICLTVFRSSSIFFFSLVCKCVSVQCPLPMCLVFFWEEAAAYWYIFVFLAQCRKDTRQVSKRHPASHIVFLDILFVPFILFELFMFSCILVCLRHAISIASATDVVSLSWWGNVFECDAQGQ